MTKFIDINSELILIDDIKRVKRESGDREMSAIVTVTLHDGEVIKSHTGHGQYLKWKEAILGGN